MYQSKAIHNANFLINTTIAHTRLDAQPPRRRKRSGTHHREARDKATRANDDSKPKHPRY